MAKTVFAGLSGGVDSAVSAALLKERGMNVVGVFIKIWQPEFIECTWAADRIDAMRAAVALDIPFREIDLSQEYKKEVVEKMLADYRAGLTPNPDVLCNKNIKFGSFLRFAQAEGADYVATGHYARIEVSNGKFSLLRGVDANKDQSYFLHMLGQNELSRALFPVGELTKPEVRALARRFDLPVAAKPDSQGLCFVGDVSMKDFLGRFMSLAKGDVLDARGNRIGEHDGAILHTVGQRHGFSITAKNAGPGPYYVTAIDTNDNILRVSEHAADAAHTEAIVEDMHWISETPELPAEFDVQTRYREMPGRARVENAGAGIRALFAKSRIASPGQSLVLYKGDACLGGGAMRK